VSVHARQIQIKKNQVRPGGERKLADSMKESKCQYAIGNGVQVVEMSILSTSFLKKPDVRWIVLD